MRGSDVFPGRDNASREWAQMFDRDVTAFMRREQDRGRDFVARPMTLGEYDPIRNHALQQHATWQAARDIAEGNRWKGIPVLDVSKLTEKVFDRPKMPPFKLEYDTLNEVSMRFRGTVIQIKGNPFMVEEVASVHGTGAGRDPERYEFLLVDNDENKTRVELSAIDDFRSIPPAYLQFNRQPVWLSRVPARVNQQGMTNQNCTMRQVTGGHMTFNSKGLLDALSTRGRVLRWSEAHLALMKDQVLSDLRLSDEVIVFTPKKSDDIMVSYRNRKFGKLLEGNVVVPGDEDDLIQPWIMKHLRKVGMEVKQ